MEFKCKEFDSKVLNVIEESVKDHEVMCDFPEKNSFKVF